MSVTRRPAPESSRFSEPFIETDRLRSVKFEVGDLDALAEICADPEVMRHVGDGAPLSRALCELWIENSRANVEHFGYGTGAVFERRSGTLIGWAGFARPEGQPEELVYGFGRASWRQGYGAEILSGLLDCAFETLGLAEVRATVHSHNQASVAMLQRQGFTLRGRRHLGDPDVHFYVLAPADAK